MFAGQNTIMKIIHILTLCTIILEACSNNQDSQNESIVYSLFDGYKAFVQDTLMLKDSLAKEQAVYLAKNYVEDGINKHAPGIKQWLLNKGINYDSVKQKGRQEIDYAYSQQNASEPYEKIHIAFEGFPDIESVKPLLEAVMKRHNITINNENILKCANVLVVFKNDSKVGVTEMEILKHIYQKGSSSIDYPTQAAVSYTYLETTK
jgi:hypothetical protein